MFGSKEKRELNLLKAVLAEASFDMFTLIEKNKKLKKENHELNIKVAELTEAKPVPIYRVAYFDTENKWQISNDFYKSVEQFIAKNQFSKDTAAHLLVR